MKKIKTLEEAAERYADKIWDLSDSNEKTLHTNCKKAFVKGAKWQFERMYSEEEVKKAQQAILGNIKDALQNENYIVEYLEQFKKK